MEEQIPYLEKTFETKRDLVDLLLELKSKFPNASSLDDLPKSDRARYNEIIEDFSIPVGQGYILGTLKFYLFHPIKSVEARRFQRRIDPQFSKY